MTKTSGKVKTWGEALDFTFQNRWKRTRSAKTALINAGHVTEFGGRSFPLRRMAGVAWWIELRSELEEQGKSNATVNRIRSAASTVLKYTHIAGLHDVKCPKFERAKESECRQTYFTKDDTQNMAAIARDLWGDRWGNNLADIMLVAFYGGFRQAELLNLRPADYDPALDHLVIGGKPWNMTKSGKVRKIAVNPAIQPIILNRLQNNRLFGEDWRNKDQLYGAFVKVRNRAGFTDDYVFHSLRHGFGTALGAVAHPRIVQEALGHSTIEMALKYCKASDTATRSALMAI